VVAPSVECTLGGVVPDDSDQSLALAQDVMRVSNQPLEARILTNGNQIHRGQNSRICGEQALRDQACCLDELVAQGGVLV
jgi:hypothetical protein